MPDVSRITRHETLVGFCGKNTARMQLLVRTGTRSVVISADKGWSGEKLRSTIATHQGMADTDMIFLTHEGKPLNLEETLSCLGITDGSYIDLHGRVLGGSGGTSEAIKELGDALDRLSHELKN